MIFEAIKQNFVCRVADNSGSSSEVRWCEIHIQLQGTEAA